MPEIILPGHPRSEQSFLMIDYKQLKEKFAGLDDGKPRVFRAPGRVNLIGEHTDYNGGFVLPMAIDREAAVAVVVRDDRKIRAHSINLDETAEFDLDNQSERKQGFWLNYVEGVARLLERRDVKLKGADLLIWSDVPGGAGLSSSAALEIVTGLALTKIAGTTVDGKTLALVGQQAEHEFVGAKVGIMDQFVSANAQKNHALLLDCRSLEFENVPLGTKDVAVVICDTRVKHDLATSGYNTRRAECEEAVWILQRFLPEILQLRDVSVAEFEDYQSELPDVIRRRARHVVTENARVLQAAKALKKNNLNELGRLMWLSHASLRDDYEVSCQELDLMVEIADACPGVLGARMTGGGFGGSTVNLVLRENLDEFTKKIAVEYGRETKIEPTILISEASAGASEVAFED
ncbi:MAG TPA: galactokinase [Pyrinomonadaceae bacterium]|nr:galactokinase [Pyrinomonadaceae bacterium]